MTTRVPHLTRSEVAALEAARLGPLTRVTGGYRRGDRKFLLATINRLFGARLLTPGPGRANLTDLGGEVLLRLNDRRSQ